MNAKKSSFLVRTKGLQMKLEEAADGQPEAGYLHRLSFV